MSGSTSKKVVVYRFDREAVPGFTSPQNLVGRDGIEILTPSGAVTLLPYTDIKVVCFVKDFETQGWKQERRVFTTRPKSEGLWVRAIFRDSDLVEGILPNDLLAWDPQGFMVVPPDPNSNNQRLFLPRAALKEFRVLGVVGTPARSRKPKPDAQPPGQFKLFE